MSQGRIQEPVVDVPVLAGRGTSSSAAVPVDTAECPDDEVFRTSPKEKSARSMRRSTAGVIGQSRSWTPARRRRRIPTLGLMRMAAGGGGWIQPLGGGTRSAPTRPSSGMSRIRLWWWWRACRCATSGAVAVDKTEQGSSCVSPRRLLENFLDCVLALFVLGNLEHYFVLALYLAVASSLSGCCFEEFELDSSELRGAILGSTADTCSASVSGCDSTVDTCSASVSGCCLLSTESDSSGDMWRNTCLDSGYMTCFSTVRFWTNFPQFLRGRGLES